MSSEKSNRLKEFFRIKTFSPAGFLCWAILLSVAFGLCHMAGLREHTTFISGTAASENGAFQTSASWGLVYMLVYFAFVLVVPILLLASGILAALLAITQGDHKTR